MDPDIDDFITRHSSYYTNLRIVAIPCQVRERRGLIRRLTIALEVLRALALYLARYMDGLARQTTVYCGTSPFSLKKMAGIREDEMSILWYESPAFRA